MKRLLLYAFLFSAPALFAEDIIVLDYYYLPGCKSCQEFIDITVPAMEEKTGQILELNKFDIMNPEYFEECRARLDLMGIKIKNYPVIFYGASFALQGDEIEKQLPDLLLSNDKATANHQGNQFLSGGSISILPVFLAGLVDGINPCAFSSMIFLISAMAVAGRGRKEILIIGISLSVSIFICYFLLGLGFFTALRSLRIFPVISSLLKWLLTGALIVLAGLSLYDYGLVRKGKSEEMILQLPGHFKKKIHTLIRTRRKTENGRLLAITGSTFVLGFVISLFELVCTGQVYLPLIAYMIKVDSDMTGYLLLVLYNFAFIIPLLIVFGVTLYGVRSQVLLKIFQRNLGRIKVLLAGVFGGLAILMFMG